MELEALWVELMLPKTRGILACSIYRSPKDGRFLEKFERALQRLEPHKELYILGDTNIDFMSKTSALYRSYLGLMNLFNLKQMINKPTRITDNACTLLDHILTNSAGKLANCGVFDYCVSDHLPVFCCRLMSRGETFGEVVKWCRSYRGYSPQIFKNKLRQVDWACVYLAVSVDEAYDYFVGILGSIIDELAPMRQVRVKQRTEAWMTGEIISSIKRRDFLFGQFKRDRTKRDVYREYCRVRNKVQRDVKLAKQVYFEGMVERSDGDSSKLWKELKCSGFAAKARSGAKVVLDVEGEKCFDAGRVAARFNEFFTGVAKSLVASLPVPRGFFSTGSAVFRDFYREKGVGRGSFQLSPVRAKFVSEQLLGLKVGKSTGLDGVSVRFLRDGAEVLAAPLCHIINLSLTSEVVPSGMKDARVTPLFKKGSRLDCGNYRPVSILNVLSKILERAVHGQFVSYLTRRGILTESQSGFRPGFLVDTCLWAYLST